MILFHNIKIEDKEWYNKCLVESGNKGSGFSFANIYAWAGEFKTQLAKVGHCGVCRYYSKEEKRYYYTMPIGGGDRRKEFQELLEAVRIHGQDVLLGELEEKDVVFLQENYPGQFEIEEYRDGWDYVYAKEDLAFLKGKKYAGKRNHIHRFEDDEDWHYEELNRSNMSECKEMAEKWYEAALENDNDDSLMERSALLRLFDGFEEFALTGGVLYKKEKVVAFTVGEPLNQDTYHVMIEKAYKEVQGAYPMINREYVRSQMEGYHWVNREEDLGIPGLRKGKESYHPAFMVKKYIAREMVK